PGLLDGRDEGLPERDRGLARDRDMPAEVGALGLAVDPVARDDHRVRAARVAPGLEATQLRADLDLVALALIADELLARGVSLELQLHPASASNWSWFRSTRLRRSSISSRQQRFSPYQSAGGPSKPAVKPRSWE